MAVPLPHPIPYQGSKRNLACAILATVRTRPLRRLFEPFAGSAALTLAAARAGFAARFVIGDSLAPLIAVWREVLASPEALADEYERIWSEQKQADAGYFVRVRDAYNREGQPAALLYLLARCVKNSPRWNREGKFNQSADRRRLGMRPDRMRAALTGAHLLLRGRAEAIAGDFEATLARAGPEDLVYMDPPWEGTSGGRDTRYHRGLQRERLIAALVALNARGVPWLLSYDGRCGSKKYGSPLPPELGAARVELRAGRSSQATLNGVEATTVESLYVSRAAGAPTVRKRLGKARHGSAGA